MPSTKHKLKFYTVFILLQIQHPYSSNMDKLQIAFHVMDESFYPDFFSIYK